MPSAPAPEISLFQIRSPRQICRPVSAFELTGSHPDSQVLATGPAQSLRCEPPVLPVPALDRLADFLGRAPSQFQGEYALPAPCVYALPEGRLLSPACVVLSANAQALQDHYLGPATLASTDALMFQKIATPLSGETQVVRLLLYRNSLTTRRVQTPCYLPFDSQHSNYHHWLIESLPTLLAYRDDPNWASSRLLMPLTGPAFQRETLELLGIDRARCLFFDGGDWRFDTLYVPSRGQFSAADLLQTQTALRTAAGVIAPARGQRRYYLSRQDAQQRRVSNEAALIQALSARGFETLQLGKLTLQEQVRRFADAAVIVGPHGAGLTNLLFAPPGCLLLDLQPEPTATHLPNHCFWVLANALKQRYSYLFCPSSGAQQYLQVPLPELDELLSALGVTA